MIYDFFCQPTIKSRNRAKIIKPRAKSNSTQFRAAGKKTDILPLCCLFAFSIIEEDLKQGRDKGAEVGDHMIQEVVLYLILQRYTKCDIDS